MSMTTVGDAISTQTNALKTASSTATGSGKSGITSDFNTFLRLLTTQLKNQDPLDPVDSSEFAVQLATFSGVEQQVKTNDLLTDLSTRLGNSGLADLAGWVGMEAKAVAPAYFHGEPIAIWPQPDPDATTAQIVVKNSFGSEVGRYDIDISTEPVSWAGLANDGTELPDGLYTFNVESFKDGAKTATAQAEVYSLITEARVENGETVLVLLGDAKMKAAAVTALRNQQ